MFTQFAATFSSYTFLNCLFVKLLSKTFFRIAAKFLSSCFFLFQFFDFKDLLIFLQNFLHLNRTSVVQNLFL